MTFRSRFSRDRLWAGLAALALFAFAILTVIGISKRSPGPGVAMLGGVLLLLLGAAALLIFRLWSLHSLAYWVQRDAIHIHWQGEEVIIPLPDIRDVRPAEVTLRPAWHRWPLQWVQVDAEKRVFSYALQPPAECLAIVTDEEIYLVSPERPDDFVAAYEQRRAFGPARKLKPVIYLAPWRQHWLLHDRLAQALLLGGLWLGWLALSYVAWRYPQLPDTIALHFNTAGAPDLLSPRRSIFLLPGISLLIGFLNAAIGFALYEYQRNLSYLLWSLSVILQIVVLFIAANLMTLAVGG